MKRPNALTLLASAALLLAAGTAQAQMYRSVGPDGTVTYSDQPPAVSAKSAPGASGGGGAGSGGALPYELNQIAQRYPVTLYTGESCAGCDSGRSMLVNRGIPFTEKTVKSNDDINALQQISGSNQLPVLTIGGQRLTGFSDANWAQYLDAAGYPKTSQLPSGYVRPPATPLVAASALPTQTAAPQPPARRAAPAQSAEPSIAPPAPTSDNPGGIQF